MKSKLIAIPYTIGIIKPHIAIKEDKVTTQRLKNYIGARGNDSTRREQLRSLPSKKKDPRKRRDPQLILPLSQRLFFP